jgi:hypothetical protein
MVCQNAERANVILLAELMLWSQITVFGTCNYTNLKKKNLSGLSPRVNYTDQATAAYQ